MASLRQVLCERFEQELYARYNLYSLAPKVEEAAQQHIIRHFKTLIGKIFRNQQGKYYLALEQDARENPEVLVTVARAFSLQKSGRRKDLE